MISTLLQTLVDGPPSNSTVEHPFCNLIRSKLANELKCIVQDFENDRAMRDASECTTLVKVKNNSYVQRFGRINNRDEAEKTYRVFVDLFGGALVKANGQKGCFMFVSRIHDLNFSISSECFECNVTLISITAAAALKKVLKLQRVELVSPMIRRWDAIRDMEKSLSFIEKGLSMRHGDRLSRLFFHNRYQDGLLPNGPSKNYPLRTYLETSETIKILAGLFSMPLNEEQFRAAVIHFMVGSHVQVINGVWGSGKTYFLCALARFHSQISLNFTNPLCITVATITSQNNEAVESFILKIREMNKRVEPYLRVNVAALGREQDVGSETAKYLLPLIESRDCFEVSRDITENEIKRILSLNVVCCTCDALPRLRRLVSKGLSIRGFPQIKFKIQDMLVDEAGSLGIDAIPLISTAIKPYTRLTFVGDVKQLPAFTRIPESELRVMKLKTSTLEALVSEGAIVSTFDSQGRINSNLANVCGKVFGYSLMGSRIRSMKHVDSKPLKKALFYVDVKGTQIREGSSSYNEEEIAAISNLVCNRVTGSYKILSLYKSQVTKLRRKFRGHVSTVDSSQGKDWNTCGIISFVASKNAPGFSKFLLDERRLNVALTRFRREVILVLDATYFASHPILGNLLEAATRIDPLIPISNPPPRKRFKIRRNFKASIQSQERRKLKKKRRHHNDTMETNKRLAMTMQALRNCLATSR